MSSAHQFDFISIDNYLADEEVSQVKHEYLGGLVHAMVGATNAHNIIATNVVVSLGGQLAGNPCRVFSSDTKIRVRMSNQTRFYYPDASIICTPNPQSDAFQDSPQVIFEVLSDSTRRIDDGEKREAYLTLPTLSHYVLFEQSTVAAIAYDRSEPGFERRIITDPDAAIEFPDSGTTLKLSDVYDGVEFERPKQADGAGHARFTQTNPGCSGHTLLGDVVRQR